ncbi:MAG TPA: AI-2E family transporter [Methanococcaceae archaeon]|uniref:AI-2E family transporter n=1 Tax=Methanothermococcus okinawensis TaxID=155863 RepID=A0A832ZKM9_9EURY|nr:AI-2E family transporter [Methanococcaceae archaeon]HIP91196.1 AI-2E family transporter [Methanothermococcus okinawensis]
MDSTEFKILTRIFVVSVFLLVLYLVHPFIDAIALSCAFAYMGKPIYDGLKRYFGRSLSALICLLIFILPTVVVGIVVLRDLAVFILQLDIQSIINSLNSILNEISKQIGYKFRIEEDRLIQHILLIWGYLEPHIRSIALQIMALPIIFLKVLVIIFLTYYFLKDGEAVKKVILSYVPREYYRATELFLNKLNQSYKNLFIGSALTSVVIGIIAAIGFYILEIPNAFILAILTGIFALLPVVGSWTVYIPLALYYILLGEVWKGIGILIFGLIFLTLLPDFLVRPLIVKNESSIHPALVLIAFLMGPLTLGLGGFAIGPLVIGAFDAIFRIKLEERYEDNSNI